MNDALVLVHRIGEDQTIDETTIRPTAKYLATHIQLENLDYQITYKKEFPGAYCITATGNYTGTTIPVTIQEFLVGCTDDLYRCLMVTQVNTDNHTVDTGAPDKIWITYEFPDGINFVKTEED